MPKPQRVSSLNPISDKTMAATKECDKQKIDKLKWERKQKQKQIKQKLFEPTKGKSNDKYWTLHGDDSQELPTFGVSMRSNNSPI